MTDKRAIRAAARAARAAFGLHPLPVPAPFAALLRPGRVVAAYAPIGEEADPAPLVAAARAAGCTLALPHVVDRATPLHFLAWNDAPLASGPFGLRQPAADGRAVAPDVILAPLVAFDAALNRIGQGAGHYDRAFARFPHARRIGVAYSVQRVAQVPADPWDVPLHALITEQGWLCP